MNEKIIKIKQEGITPVIPGEASGAKDFFNQVIKDQFADKEAIKATHEALMEYINDKNAVYALRMFGSDPNRNYENLRRGFLTIFPTGYKMVFCDNTFAMPFAAMKLTGTKYTAEQLKEYMNNPATRVGLGMTQEEKELAFYNWNKNKANINLNINGWYLAHITPVGRKFSGKNLGNLFKNPDRSEWGKNSDKIRRPDTDLSAEELAMLKAHFLRMIHPLNSFVVPKKTLLAYNGQNIGEETELINIVREYIKAEFPKEYEELNSIMQIPEEEVAKSHIGKVIWGPSESAIEKTKKGLKADTYIADNQEEGADIYDLDEAENLQRILYSIGKSAFLKIYPLVKKNPDISIDQIISACPEYKTYSVDALKSRLSNTRRIIREGMELEALSNVLNSSRLNDEDRDQAMQFIADLL